LFDTPQTIRFIRLVFRDRFPEAVSLQQAFATLPDRQTFAAACRKMSPLVEFTTRALGQKY